MSERYKTIVADPPWSVKAGPRSLHAADDGYRRQAASGLSTRVLKYDVLSVSQLMTLPVSELAEPSAHLYIWTINAYVEQTYAIARAWGFKPSTLLVWCKKPKGRGLGGRYSTATEYVLFCQRGNHPSDARCERNWWEWPRSAHSAKPDAFLDIVEQVSPGPYVELFSRRCRFGWDYRWHDGDPAPVAA
jgi:N6-adenosine-specific RNA methylase IME4